MGANFVRAVAQLLHMVLYIFSLIIIVRSIISWVGSIPPNAFIYTLRKMTDPIFRWVHRNLPFTVVGGIDISPIFILLVLYFIDNLIYNFLMDYANHMAGGL
jgi:YggT family protein